MGSFKFPGDSSPPLTSPKASQILGAPGLKRPSLRIASAPPRNDLTTNN